MRQRFNSVDSPSYLTEGTGGTTSPIYLGNLGSPLGSLRSPESIVGTDEWNEKQRNLVKLSYTGKFTSLTSSRLSLTSLISLPSYTSLFSSLYTEKERKRLEDYSAHKLEEKDSDHVYHLPPIEPPTPSLNKARKILQMGDGLVENATFRASGTIEEEESNVDSVEHEASHSRPHTQPTPLKIPGQESNNAEDDEDNLVTPGIARSTTL